jgi:imidazolonepropionase-like amidohydrolase
LDSCFARRLSKKNEIMANAGMSNIEVLRSAIFLPALFLKMDYRVGSIKNKVFFIRFKSLYISVHAK